MSVVLKNHGEPGHLNVLTKDQDSDYTGFGKHNRLVVFGDVSRPQRTVMVREDFKWDLPASTEAQRRNVLNGWQRQHPPRTRIEYLYSTEKYRVASWESIEHHYRIVYPLTAGSRQGRSKQGRRAGDR